MFSRLLCAFKGKYYSEGIDEQRRNSEESVGSVNESEDVEDSVNASGLVAVVSTSGEREWVNSVSGASSSGDDEEVSTVAEPSSRDTDASGEEDSAGGWGDGDDAMYVGGPADGDVGTRLSNTRAVLNLGSNTFLSTSPGGGFGRCFIEVWAKIWFCWMETRYTVSELDVWTV